MNSQTSLYQGIEVDICWREREKYREESQENDLFLNIYVYEIYTHIKCYVTFSYETGLLVKFNIHQP